MYRKRYYVKKLVLGCSLPIRWAIMDKEKDKFGNDVIIKVYGTEWGANETCKEMNGV